MSERKPIPVDELSPQQLAQVGQTLENDVQSLGEGLALMRQAKARLEASLNSVGELASAKGKTALLPLTGSLYIPGQISESEKVLVDVGTGYFVEKSSKEAKTLYTRRLFDVGKNIDGLSAQHESKLGMMRQVEAMLAQKIREK